MNNLCLHTLSLVGFKNYFHASLHFSEKFNCIVGDNGEGKTNLLDAIYYLSCTKSFLNSTDQQNIHHDSTMFMIQGFFSVASAEEEVVCAQLKDERKQLRVNKSEVIRFADHIGKFPIVLSSPLDIELIFDGSEARRRFMDNLIAQYDRHYLEDLIVYTKALQQRNAQLKLFSKTPYDADSLAVWSLQLIETGKRIYEKRKSVSADFLPVFQKYYSRISSDKERVGWGYKSPLDKGDFEALLNEAMDRDRAMEYTSVGIHKDDWEFKINDQPIKKFASQGQQKSYLLAVKLSQYEFIKQKKQTLPILLLDDVYDKLDERRLTSLLQLLSTPDFGQIVITDTGETRIKNIFENMGQAQKMFKVTNGEVVVC
jgi:DNA replication and repair protein RecF